MKALMIINCCVIGLWFIALFLNIMLGVITGNEDDENNKERVETLKAIETDRFEAYVNILGRLTKMERKLRDIERKVIQMSDLNKTNE